MAYYPEQYQVRAYEGVYCRCLRYGCLGCAATYAPPTPVNLFWNYRNPVQENQLKLLDYLPPKLTLGSSSQSIEFFERGRLGPFIQDIINKTVVLDNADEKLFEEKVWRTTMIQIDIEGSATTIYTDTPVSKFLKDDRVIQTRQQFMERLAELIQPFVDTKRGYKVLRGQTNLKKLRLVGAQYYPNPDSPIGCPNSNYRWMPTLAI